MSGKIKTTGELRDFLANVEFSGERSESAATQG